MELDYVFGGWEEIELNNFISPGVTRWGWKEGEEEEMENMDQRRVGKAQQEAWVLEAGIPWPWTRQAWSHDLILEGGWASHYEGGPVCRWGRARSQGDSHPEACLVRVEGIRVMLFCPRGANTQGLDLKLWCCYPMETNFNSRKLEGSRKTWSGPERESGNSRTRWGLWGTISDRVSLGSTGCQGCGAPHPCPEVVGEHIQRAEEKKTQSLCECLCQKRPEGTKQGWRAPWCLGSWTIISRGGEDSIRMNLFISVLFCSVLAH